jgi:outer membrane murein-binding lipoprotein Lpp
MKTTSIHHLPAFVFGVLLIAGCHDTDGSRLQAEREEVATKIHNALQDIDATILRLEDEMKMVAQDERVDRIGDQISVLETARAELNRLNERLGEVEAAQWSDFKSGVDSSLVGVQTTLASIGNSGNPG